MVTIFLDAGHGGKDGGASANGLKEKDIVLKIVKEIEKQLNDYECRVEMSRESDVFLSLNERTNKANLLKCDCLVSVHVNSAKNITARGFETYRFPNSGQSTIAFQNLMHKEIMRAIGKEVSDRGKKAVNFHMLRESNMKAILTENLFVSNGSDAKLLKDDVFSDKVATGHVNGLVQFFGLRKKKAIEQPTLQPPTDSDKLYRVRVGDLRKKKTPRIL